MAKKAGTKTNKTVRSVKRVGAGTADAFFVRSAARATKLDRGETLLPEIRLTLEAPADLIRVLTEQRVHVPEARGGIRRQRQSRRS